MGRMPDGPIIRGDHQLDVAVAIMLGILIGLCIVFWFLDRRNRH